MKNAPSILVIDDEPDNFDVVESLLDNVNCQLSYASSGRIALTRLEVLQPDVILLDVMMPGLNGIEVCRIIKQDPRWKAVPIIMITALTSKQDMALCLEAGASDFLSKPVNGVELRARVKSMIRMKQQYDDLQSLLQTREDMVRMIVHDLRNPLSTIILSATLLGDPALSEVRKAEKIARLNRSTQRLQSLIDSLLLMAKLESGKMVLKYTSINLNQMCLALAEDFEAIAAQKNLEIIVQLPEDSHESSQVNVDVSMFRRILDNLLSNSIKFSPSNNQIIISVEYPESGGANISVADRGIGTTDEMKLVIFDKYEIGTPVQNTAQLGLGLAFCKLAIEAHGGSIFVKDNQPQGSIFTIAIPQHNN
jgi:signal transduction histidine kinase